MRYSLESVVADATQTIDGVWERLPDLRVFCRTVGGYHGPDGGFWTLDGDFLSYDGAAYLNKERSKADTAEADR